MNCPKCNLEQADQNVECMRCGIVFEKYRMHHTQRPTPVCFHAASDEKAAAAGEVIKHVLFYVNPQTHPVIFGGRVLFFLIMLVWGVKFIFTPMETNYVFTSFWHLVNLPFHEAGHIFFRPFGRFMTSLGGSLGQLLMPLMCMAVFIIKTRDTFAASFTLWWFGENVMDLAPYINDARSLTLPLVGGNTGRTSPYGFHDWEFILRESGFIRYDHMLAGFVHKIGIFLIIGAFIWGGYLLLKQYRQLKQ